MAEALGIARISKGLTITCYVRMGNCFLLLQSSAHHIITRPVKLDKTVARVSVVKTGCARRTSIPIRTIETLPTYSCNMQLAHITSGVVDARLVREEVDTLLQVTVEHGLECVRGGVQGRRVEKGEARATEIIVRAVFTLVAHASNLLFATVTPDMAVTESSFAELACWGYKCLWLGLDLGIRLS